MLRGVMAGGLGEKTRPVLHRPALRVGRPPIKPAQARERDRRRAHRTGLKRHIEIAADKPFRAQRLAGSANRQDFGVRGRVLQFQRSIPRPRQDHAVAQNNRAHGHLTARTRRLRVVERKRHWVDSAEYFRHENLFRSLGCSFRLVLLSNAMPQDHGRPHRPKRPPARAQARNPEKTGERIAKVMARVGLCSRRDAEAWIAEGRVAVNGTVLTSPATNIGPEDKVEVDGKPLAQRQRTRLFLFNKPRGLVTTNKDPEGRQTIFAYLAQHHPDAPRLVSVGRLDINTEGLLLLTNDGGLARVLELPSTGWLRRYRVRANGETDQAQLDTLKNGVTIEGIHYAGIDATLDRVQGANSWLTMALREGKNREIKRVLEHFRLEVNRLIRLSFGPFQLGDLADGGLEEVRGRVLRDQLGETLLRESGADLDAPLTAEPEPEIEPRRPPRERPAGAQRKMRTNRSAPEPEPDKPRHRPLPGPRKHVSALRAQEEAKGPRQRIERATTEDRKGRTIAIERHVLAKPPKKSRFADKFRSPAKADSVENAERPRASGRPQKTGRPERPERGFAKRPERPAGERPQRSPAQRPERSATERPEWSATKRPERTAGKRPERNRAERPERSFAKRSEGPAGKRPERGTAQRPERSATKRPEWSAEKRAERPAGKRPERNGAERPERSFAKRPERPAGKRPARGPQKTGRPDAPRRPPRGR
jgi:23S rRNA pseudouridine2605 synthase